MVLILGDLIRFDTVGCQELLQSDSLGDMHTVQLHIVVAKNLFPGLLLHICHQRRPVFVAHLGLSLGEAGISWELVVAVVEDALSGGLGGKHVGAVAHGVLGHEIDRLSRLRHVEVDCEDGESSKCSAHCVCCFGVSEIFFL